MLNRLTVITGVLVLVGSVVAHAGCGDIEIGRRNTRDGRKVGRKDVTDEASGVASTGQRPHLIIFLLVSRLWSLHLQITSLVYVAFTSGSLAQCFISPPSRFPRDPHSPYPQHPSRSLAAVVRR